MLPPLQALTYAQSHRLNPLSCVLLCIDIIKMQMLPDNAALEMLASMPLASYRIRVW